MGYERVDDYINTISPGRVMMTTCCLPYRLPSGLLVYSGLRYTQRETATVTERPGAKDGTLDASAGCSFT